MVRVSSASLMLMYAPQCIASLHVYVILPDTATPVAAVVMANVTASIRILAPRKKLADHNHKVRYTAFQ